MLVRKAFFFAVLSAGRRRAISSAITQITTSNSIKVNAWRADKLKILSPQMPRLGDITAATLAERGKASRGGGSRTARSEFALGERL